MKVKFPGKSGRFSYFFNIFEEPSVRFLIWGHLAGRAKMENMGKVWPRINHGTKFGLEAQLWRSERSADSHRALSSPIPEEPLSCSPCPMPVVDLYVWVL